jgi:hypothetical protein
LQVDKRLKLEQPTGIDLKSTDTRPIKATKLALDVIRADEIAIENSNTGKVTAVVAIVKVFGDKSNSRNSKLLINSLSAKSVLAGEKLVAMYSIST